MCVGAFTFRRVSNTFLAFWLHITLSSCAASHNMCSPSDVFLSWSKHLKTVAVMNRSQWLELKPALGSHIDDIPVERRKLVCPSIHLLGLWGSVLLLDLLQSPLHPQADHSGWIRRVTMKELVILITKNVIDAWLEISSTSGTFLTFANLLHETSFKKVLFFKFLHQQKNK